MILQVLIMMMLVFALLIKLLNGIIVGNISPLFVPFLVIYTIIFVLAVLVGIFANMRIFEKAGINKYLAFVPFANLAKVYEMYWGDWRVLIVAILFFFQTIGESLWSGIIFSIALCVITAKKQAAAFGVGGSCWIGLFLLNPIFSISLAYGDHQYAGVPQDGWTAKDIVTKVKRGLEFIRILLR